jgi:hypothetical protein
MIARRTSSDVCSGLSRLFRPLSPGSSAIRDDWPVPKRREHGTRRHANQE